jgi:hypothetical protein
LNRNRILKEQNQKQENGKPVAILSYRDGSGVDYMMEAILGTEKRLMMSSWN